MDNSEPSAQHGLVTERRGSVLVCRFDRSPAVNASTPDVMSAWYAEIVSAAADPSVRAVVTSNAGRGWCVGADMGLLLRYQAAEGQPKLNELAWELLNGRPRLSGDPGWDALGLNHVAMQMLHHTKPLVAAIDGAVAGGGVPLALLHDVRFVSVQSSFTAAFLGLGLVSELGLTHLLPRAVGTGKALDLLLSGRSVFGPEAVRLGLAEHLVDDGVSVEEQAVAYAASLAELPQHAVAALRRLVRVDSALPVDEFLVREWQVQVDAHTRSETRDRIAKIAARLGFK